MTVIASCLLAACASHEGRYSPACMAYEGNNIELHDGQFVWGKFTDSVVVDDDGKIVNQFPGYPMQGSYRIDGQTVIMETAAGDALADMYFHQDKDRHYLLTAEQLTAWERTGEYDDCALVLGGNADH
jgi:hypothetical protein